MTFKLRHKVKLCDNLERMKIVTHRRHQPEKPVAGIKLEQDDSAANAKRAKVREAEEVSKGL